MATSRSLPVTHGYRTKSPPIVALVELPYSMQGLSFPWWTNCLCRRAQGRVCDDGTHTTPTVEKPDVSCTDLRRPANPLDGLGAALPGKSGNPNAKAAACFGRGARTLQPVTGGSGRAGLVQRNRCVAFDSPANRRGIKDHRLG